MGAANRFHGRVQDGRAFFGGQEFDGVAFVGSDPGEAVGYVRPHELGITREPDGRASIRACVVSAHAAGPMPRVRLTEEHSAGHVEVVLPRDRLDELAPRAGERVHLIPRRLRMCPAAIAASRRNGGAEISSANEGE